MNLKMVTVFTGWNTLVNQDNPQGAPGGEALPLPMSKAIGNGEKRLVACPSPGQYKGLQEEGNPYKISMEILKGHQKALNGKPQGHPVGLHCSRELRYLPGLGSLF